jgi:hypothetical protein
MWTLSEMDSQWQPYCPVAKIATKMALNERPKLEKKEEFAGRSLFSRPSITARLGSK